MKIYDVVPIFKGEDIVVVANSGSEAIKMAVDYFNQRRISDFEPDDFFYNVINVDEISEPMIINE